MAATQQSSCFCIAVSCRILSYATESSPPPQTGQDVMPISSLLLPRAAWEFRPQQQHRAGNHSSLLSTAPLPGHSRRQGNAAGQELTAQPGHAQQGAPTCTQVFHLPSTVLKHSPVLRAGGSAHQCSESLEHRGDHKVMILQPVLIEQDQMQHCQKQTPTCVSSRKCSCGAPTPALAKAAAR